MKILINAVSAKLGGAATYIHNLARALPQFAERSDQFVFVAPSAHKLDAQSQQVSVITSDAATGSYARRWWWDQVDLRGIVERERPDALFSSANFAMLRCPCPQVLLVRNPIYFSREYLEYVLPQHGVALRAETAVRRWLVAQSVAAADCVMTPSRTMLDDLRRFMRIAESRACVNPYGVPASRVLPGVRQQCTTPPLRLLWVSHYADHKNLPAMLEAARILRERAAFPFTLTLTLDPQGAGQHTPMPAHERAALDSLRDVVRLAGVQSYEATWKMYSEADGFLFPSLTESFGHPLVEAMASQLPIIASDISIHREICGDAALYFSPRCAQSLAAQISRLAGNPGERRRLAELGRERVKQFLWEDHVVRLLAALRDTAQVRRARAA